jgi:hypothetical protein
MNVWTGQILYMEMNHAIAVNQSMSFAIPSVRGAVDVRVMNVYPPLDGGGKLGNTEGPSDGLLDADGWTVGILDGTIDGRSDGPLDVDGADDGAFDGWTVGMQDG